MTAIEWTEKTWNPLVGCSVVSPGCKRCYAMRQAARIARMSPDLAHYQGLTQPSAAGPVWTGRVAEAGFDKLVEPVRRRKPTTWFVNSMSDLFHEGVDRWTIARVWAVMLLTPQHTYQLLTKRSARMREIVGDPAFIDLVCEAATTIMGAMQVDEAGVDRYRALRDAAPGSWPVANIWLGVSAEDQPRADERVPDVLATPAAVRWVSAEPLLGAIDFTGWFWGREAPCADCPKDVDCACGAEPRGKIDGEPAIDWIVVGGESGQGARPILAADVRSIRDQCAAAGVAFFWKQWGEWIDADQWLAVLAADGHRFLGDGGGVLTSPLNFSDAQTLARLSGAEYQHHSDGSTTIRVGKRRAGRMLDGRIHDEMPRSPE